MKVTMQTWLGCNYAAPSGEDCEVYSSLAIAKDMFAAAADGPLVEGEVAALIWFGEYDDVTDIYPDRRLTIGPRGGVRVEHC